MGAFFGLLLMSVVVPAAYAGAFYLLATHSDGVEFANLHVERLAALVAAPLVLSGLVRWWDVWVKPGPKMSLGYPTMKPGKFTVRVLRGHGLFFLILAVLFLSVGSIRQRAEKPIDPAELAKLEDEFAKNGKQLEEMNKTYNTFVKPENPLDTTAATKHFEMRAELGPKIKELEDKNEELGRKIEMLKETKSFDLNIRLYLVYLLLIAGFATVFRSPIQLEDDEEY